MSIDIQITLENVINKLEELPWEYALYIPTVDASWSAGMKCMILDPDVTDDPDDDPDVAKVNGLKYALMVSDVQDIIENANVQKASVEKELLIDAIKYYYNNGAFITLS